MECSDVGVHRPAFANIHVGPDGAYSIALTGCYEYTDKGTHFEYSGTFENKTTYLFLTLDVKIKFSGL